MKEFFISESKLEKWEEIFESWLGERYTNIDKMLDEYAEKNIGKTDGQFFRAFVSGYEYAKHEEEVKE